MRWLTPNSEMILTFDFVAKIPKFSVVLALVPDSEYPASVLTFPVPLPVDLLPRSCLQVLFLGPPYTLQLFRAYRGHFELVSNSALFWG